MDEEGAGDGEGGSTSRAALVVVVVGRGVEGFAEDVELVVFEGIEGVVEAGGCGVVDFVVVAVGFFFFLLLALAKDCRNPALSCTDFAFSLDSGLLFFVVEDEVEVEIAAAICGFFTFVPPEREFFVAGSVACLFFTAVGFVINVSNEVFFSNVPGFINAELPAKIFY